MVKAVEDSFLSTDFLTVGQAAAYLGVSEQTLRRWEQEGKLRALRNPANNYRHYRLADLEPFKLEYRSAEMAAAESTSIFQTAKAHIANNPLLREPQEKAVEALKAHFAESTEPACSIPVGCGKTGLIAICPFGLSNGKVLVLVPNVTIRDGVSETLEFGAKNFWRKQKVLDSFTGGPFTAVLDGPAPTSTTAPTATSSSRTFSSWPARRIAGCRSSPTTSST